MIKSNHLTRLRSKKKWMLFHHLIMLMKKYICKSNHFQIMVCNSSSPIIIGSFSFKIIRHFWRMKYDLHQMLILILPKNKKLRLVKTCRDMKWYQNKRILCKKAAFLCLPKVTVITAVNIWWGYQLSLDLEACKHLKDWCQSV